METRPQVTRPPADFPPVSAIEPLEARVLLAAILVRDINPTGPSSPRYLTNLNGTILFTVDDGTHGVELWRSDGTNAGTTLVRDIAPGATSSNPTLLTSVNDVVYFVVGTKMTGVQLWRSDGTEAGTILVKQISSADEAGDNAAPVRAMTQVNDTLFFIDDTQYNAERIWKSDGTGVGTTVVKSLGTSSFDGPWISEMTAFRSKLYFTRTTSTGCEFWRSDGTSSRTVKVKTFEGDVGPITVFDDHMYFSAPVPGVSDARTGLWQSDGTLAETAVLKDPGSAGHIKIAADAGNALFFALDSGTNPSDLWKTSGTPSTTSFVAHLPEPQAALFGPVALNGALFFSTYDDLHGYTLWRSDGTKSGTGLFKDINPGVGDSFDRCPIVVGGTLYFFTNDGSHGEELWQSDGTPGGTKLVQDIRPGAKSSFNPGPSEEIPPVSIVTATNDGLFFSASNGTNGEELWMKARDFASLAQGKLRIEGTAASDSIGLVIRAGNLRVRCNGGISTFPLVDVTRIEISARDGDDIMDFSGIAIPTYVDAGPGNDLVTAGNGNDSLTGDAGKDTLYGGEGDDRINGNGTQDKLYGQGGNDRMYGGDHDDLLDGGGGVDRIWGDGGNDTIIGGGSSDKLYGGAGDDRITGGAGVDLFFAEAGDDSIFAADGLAETVDGGDGTDTVQADDALDVLLAVENTIA